MASLTSRAYSTRLERYGKQRNEADSGTAPANFTIGATGGGAGPVLSVILTDDDTVARAHPGTGRRYRLDMRGAEIVRLARHMLASDILAAPMAEAAKGAAMVLDSPPRDSIPAGFPSNSRAVTRAALGVLAAWMARNSASMCDALAGLTRAVGLPSSPPDPAAIAACRAVLAWASAPGDHGGNPYSKPHVKAAERALAAHEGRAVEDWAKHREGEGRSWPWASARAGNAR